MPPAWQMGEWEQLQLVPVALGRKVGLKRFNQLLWNYLMEFSTD